MYYYMDAVSPWFPPIYFCVLVLCGSYFFLNLILAVIIEAYNSIDKVERKKEIELLEKTNLAKRNRLEAVR
jgi:hypothetical protein